MTSTFFLKVIGSLENTVKRVRFGEGTKEQVTEARHRRESLRFVEVSFFCRVSLYFVELILSFCFLYHVFFCIPYPCVNGVPVFD